MSAHQLLFVGVETLWLHQDPILDADLAYVVEHARELYLLDQTFGETDLSCDRARNPRNPIRVAARKPVLRVNGLREGADSAEEQFAGSRVLAKREPGQIEGEQ